MTELILNFIALLSFAYIFISFWGKSYKIADDLMSFVLFSEVLFIVLSIYMPLQSRLPEDFSLKVSAPISVVVTLIGMFSYFFLEKPNKFGLLLGFSVLGATGALFRLISY